MAWHLPESATAAPQLSAEQRAWFGLEEGESVRVLASGPRTVLLERLGGSPAAALPWDRALVLSADVRAFPIADLLHLVHSSAKSGFLHFEKGDHAKSVYLHGGEVVFAASNQPVDRLGATLLRAGLITPEQFNEARRVYTPGERFGRIVVERGFLTPRELWDGLKMQVEEIVRSLFAYGSGTVHFWEGEVRPDNVVRLSLPSERLIAEGMRRRDELLRFLAWLEDSRARLRPVNGANLTGTERVMYEALAGEASFPALCRKVGVDPLTGARTVQLLRLLGAVKVERLQEAADGSPEGPTRGGDERALHDCVIRHVKLLGELAAPIVAVEGGERLGERLGNVLEEAAQRYPAILEGTAVGRGAVLDPQPIIERALRFPGERECEVRTALGELVSYLEFELLNHPKIPDPELFLEELEELRANL